MDTRSRVAAVVDPDFGLGQCIADAEAAGCRIRYVFFTSPDIVVTQQHLDLRDRLGASVYVSPCSSLVNGIRVVRDGDVIEVGNMRLTVICSQSIQPAALGLLVYDLEQSDRDPVALLSGETLLCRASSCEGNTAKASEDTFAGSFIHSRGGVDLACAPTG